MELKVGDKLIIKEDFQLVDAEGTLYEKYMKAEVVQIINGDIPYPIGLVMDEWYPINTRHYFSDKEIQDNFILLSEFRDKRIIEILK